MPAKTVLTSFAFVSALTLACAAQAGPAPTTDPDGASMKVSVADLDLRNDAGAQAALHRIQAASKFVCGGEPDGRLLQQRSNYIACVAVTTDRAVKSLASPRVTALYSGSGRSIALVSR